MTDPHSSLKPLESRRKRRVEGKRERIKEEEKCLGGLGDFKMEVKEEAGKGVGELHNSSSLMLLDQT